MRLIVDMNIICLAPGSGSYVYAMFRKEFETDLVPMVGMGLEDPAWKESRIIKSITINPAQGYYFLHVGDESGNDKDQCEQFKQMYYQHGWHRPAEVR